jgi:hypothetical protein
MPDERLTLSGINAVTGECGLPPMTGQELSSFITREARPENLAELGYRQRLETIRHPGIREGADSERLEQAGWGVILVHDAGPEVDEALDEMLALRRAP